MAVKIDFNNSQLAARLRARGERVRNPGSGHYAPVGGGDVIDELNRLAKMIEWRPIEEVRKSSNKKYYLLRGDSGYKGTPFRYIVARYDSQFRPRQPWIDYAGDSVLDSGEMPTHYRELEEYEELEV